VTCLEADSRTIASNGGFQALELNGDRIVLMDSVGLKRRCQPTFSARRFPYTLDQTICVDLKGNPKTSLVIEGRPLQATVWFR
jgi:hypothetical protein